MGIYGPFQTNRPSTSIKLIQILLLGMLISAGDQAFAQSEPESDPPVWDQLLFFGNKVSWGQEKWKYSGEFQVRLQDYGQALDNWFLEGVASYMPSENWEIVPDFRLSIHPDQVEYRPGFGLLRKDLFRTGENKAHQFVNQLKYQADFQPGSVNHGLRYILFYNYLASEKILFTAVGGIFYSWKKNFTGIEFIRGGPGISYIFNRQHSLNFLYFVGTANQGNSWIYQGNFITQLVINIDRDYKYVPAKYINF